jgi:hypothetical protein
MLQGEISSLSCEQHPGSELVVSLFEVPFSADSVAAFIAREHEFRFLAVQPYDLAGQVPTERLAVSAAGNISAAACLCCHGSVHCCPSHLSLHLPCRLLDLGGCKRLLV